MPRDPNPKHDANDRSPSPSAAEITGDGGTPAHGDDDLQAGGEVAPSMSSGSGKTGKAEKARTATGASSGPDSSRHRDANSS